MFNILIDQPIISLEIYKSLQNNLLVNFFRITIIFYLNIFNSVVWLIVSKSNSNKKCRENYGKYMIYKIKSSFLLMLNTFFITIIYNIFHLKIISHTIIYIKNIEFISEPFFFQPPLLPYFLFVSQFSYLY